MKDFPLVYIIIVNWDEQKLLKECLTSIKDSTDYPNFRVVIVDNGSTDGSVTMVRQNFPWVELIENRVNLGFAKANNQGIKHALKQGADYVFLLNNDTRILHSDWLNRMIELAEANPNIGIVGCKLIYPDGRIQHAGGVITVRDVFHRGGGERDDGKYDKIREVDYVTGAAFMIKKEVVRKIGLFDEYFSPLYFEETDYCERARLAKYRVIYNPKTTILHYARVTVKKERLPEVHAYYLVHKNRIRFMLLNFPLQQLLRRTKYELKTIMSIIFEKKDETKRLSPFNSKLRKNWHVNLITLLKAYYNNLKLLGDILQKRRNRTLKIWY